MREYSITEEIKEEASERSQTTSMKSSAVAKSIKLPLNQKHDLDKISEIAVAYY